MQKSDQFFTNINPPILGTKVLIKNTNELRSTTAKLYRGKPVIVTQIHNYERSPYIITDVPECQGVWFDELEGFDLEYETVG